jgi:hypothetical protein
MDDVAPVSLYIIYELFFVGFEVSLSKDRNSLLSGISHLIAAGSSYPENLLACQYVEIQMSDPVPSDS